MALYFYGNGRPEAALHYLRQEVRRENGHVYWTDQGTSKIQRSDLDGSRRGVSADQEGEARSPDRKSVGRLGRRACGDWTPLTY